MSQSKIIGFMTEKAPGRGYKLAKIVNLVDDQGQPQMHAEVVAYRTTLPEIQLIEHQMKEQLFGESAWFTPPLPARAPVPMSGETPTNEADLPDGMPAVVENYRESGGMMGELYRRGNGAMRAMVPMLFIASLWVAVNLRPLVA